MSRPEGLAKTSGRRAGTPNRRTSDLESKLKTAGLDPIAQLAQLLPDLDPRAQAEALLALLPYLYPKRKSVEVIRDPVDRESRLVIVMNGEEPLREQPGFRGTLAGQ